MKKLLFVCLTITVISVLLITGCSKGTTTTSPPSTTAAKTTAAAPTTTAAAAKEGPVAGGTYTVICNLPIVNNVGYPREMPTNEASWWAETLAELSDAKGTLTPLLAKSWEEDTNAKTLTVHLQPGVKFHDGTEFNAEAAKWNYEEKIAGKTFSLWPVVSSITVIDTLTLKFNLTDYTYDTPEAILTGAHFHSPTAIQANGKDWALVNETGTGPFRITEIKPDVSITMEKFADYWQKDKGYPYLDKLIYKTVGDALVAQALMESGQADTWETPSDPTIFPQMEKKGFIAKYSGRPINALQWFLFPEVKADSIFNDINVRQAIACALDTKGIALSIGKGIYDPLNQLVYQGLYAYNPDFHDYDYNVEKAKKYLADAGYPTGFDTTLTYEPGEKDDATAIADCLGKVGINVKLNMVSFGAFFQAAMTGWDGLLLLFSGVGNDIYGISSFSTWLGPTRSMPFQMRDWSPEVLSLLNKGLHTYDAELRKDIAKQLFTAAAAQLNIIPVYQRPNAVLYQKWVHTDYPGDGGIQYRHIYKVWMDPHE